MSGVGKPCRICGGTKYEIVKEAGRRYYCTRCREFYESIPNKNPDERFKIARNLAEKGIFEWRPMKPPGEKCLTCCWNSLRKDSHQKAYCFKVVCEKDRGYKKRVYGGDLIDIIVRHPYKVRGSE